MRLATPLFQAFIVGLTACSTTEAFSRQQHSSRRATKLRSYSSYGGGSYGGGSNKRRPSFAPDYYDDYKDENDALHIPNRLGITTKSWKSLKDCQEATNLLLENGITFISCAHGTESLAGKVLASQPYDATIAVAPYNPRFSFFSNVETSMLSAMDKGLNQLQLDEAEILQVRPSKASTVNLNGLATGLVSAIDEGYSISAGAVDITTRGTLRRFCRQLDLKGEEELLSNEFEFSLVNRKHEAMIQYCKDHNVIPLIRYPLGRDLLASGRWTSTDPGGVGGEGRKFTNKVLEKYEPLHSMQYRVLEKVQQRAPRGGGERELKDFRARRYEEKKKRNTKLTAAQVAINYVVAKGGVPLVDVHDEDTAQELLGCLGWRLSDEEVGLLDQAAELSDM